MRLDLYLKKTLITKNRNVVKKLCETGLIKVNGAIAKPARKIKIDDIIEIETAKGVEKYRVVMLPAGNVKRNEGSRYYEKLTQT